MPTHPGLDRALKFLAQHLETHAVEALPSVAELARTASVSYVTMRRAVDSLRTRGVIAPRGRLRLAGSERFAAEAHTDRVWKSVARTIERNVLESANVSETLGSIKELCARYGVCHRTMVRSLEQLRVNGFLERRGRRWAVMRAAPGAPLSTVVVFLRGTGTGIFVYPVRTWEYLRILESECSRAGIAVEPCTLEYSGRSLNVAGALRRFETIRSRSAVLGAMVWTMGLGAFNATSFLARLQRYGQPISVLDEVNRVPGDTARRLSGVRLVRVAFGEHAGLSVGRHLAALGHRTIGFVSHVPLDSYALIRLRGLRKACAQAGLTADAVRVVAPARSAGDIADPPDTSVLSPPLLRRCHCPDNRRNFGPDLAKCSRTRTFSGTNATSP